MLNHIDTENKKKSSVSDEIKKLNESPILEKPEDLVFKLVDNFKWVIQMERRRKGLTVKQLAEALRESESAINLLEKGIVPSKSFDLIQSLEQFLKIKIIKRDLIEQLEEQKKRDAIVDSLLTSKKEEIRFEKELKKPEILFEQKQEKPLEEIKLEAKPLNFRQGIVEHAKIRDLQKLNNRIEKDFEFQTKTRDEVGKEQVETAEKNNAENSEPIKREIYKTRIESKPKNTTPSIYDLMKKKEEKNKGMLGKEIEIVEKPKEEKKEEIDKAKWEELE